MVEWGDQPHNHLQTSLEAQGELNQPSTSCKEASQSSDPGMQTAPSISSPLSTTFTNMPDSSSAKQCKADVNNLTSTAC